MPIATVDGRRLHYQEAGTGDRAVVLLHAFPLHAAMWDDQLVALSDRWRVIAPDLPGFGDSEPLPDPDTASLDSMADAVAGLISHLGLSRAVIGGLSMGGYLAFVLARRHRSLVEALVLADTRAAADTDEVKERRSSQQQQARAEGTAELIDTMLGTLLAETTRTGQPDTIDRVRRLMERASPQAFVAALQAMKDRADASDELAGLNVPTLVLVGDQDATAPVEVAEEMCAELPDCRLAVIESAGHLSNLENPEAFTAELRSFLESLPRS